MVRWFVIALGCCVVFLAGACKKPIKDDLSSPQATLDAFFRALASDRIPQRLSTYIVSDREIAIWKMRCESRGCRNGTYKLLGVGEVEDNLTTLLVSFTIEGDEGAVVMRGKDSPVHFERLGETWKIVQFGKRLDSTGTIVPPGTEPVPAPPSGSDPDDDLDDTTAR